MPEAKKVRLLRGLVILIVAFVAVGSVIPTPLGKAKEKQSPAPLLTGAVTDERLIALVRRACVNCHSNETRWPWYGSVAPASWLVERDVIEGRKQMNFSRWPEYGPEGQRQLLGQTAEQVESRAMPPDRYEIMHAEARLTAEERALIARWARMEAERIQ
jgi:cytochrome c